MTLKQLEAFYFAATLGSFVLAAQRVHVTQSSLSKRIAELEVWIGKELFVRAGKKVHLTEAGHRLMRVATQILTLKEDARGMMDGPVRLSGTCTFGISELGALTWLPRFVAQAREQYPELILQPHVDLGRRLERQVIRGELDFAIVPGPPDDATLTQHKVGDVRFVWTAAPGRLRPGCIMKPSDLAKYPVITMTDGSGLTQAFDRWAAAQGLRMQRFVASNSLMAIIGLTIADVGVSFLPKAFLQPWIDGGALTTFRSSPALPVLQYCFIHREDDKRALLPILLRNVLDVAEYTTMTEYTRKTIGRARRKRRMSPS